MIEPRAPLRILTALGVSAFFALGFVAVFMWASLGASRRAAPPESPDARRARCAAAPQRDVRLPAREFEVLADGDALLEAARLTPVRVESATVGFELSGIRPGSIFDRVGLCDGDVVSSVAGVSVDSTRAQLEVYERLQGLSSAPVEIVRRGERHVFSVGVE